MTDQEMTDEIEIFGHYRKWDSAEQAGTPAALAFEQWFECVRLWGVRSPAALGCLLALAREAWGDPELSTQGGEHTGWTVSLGSDRGDAECVGRGGDELAALVAALDAAPKRLEGGQ